VRERYEEIIQTASKRRRTVGVWGGGLHPEAGRSLREDAPLVKVVWRTLALIALAVVLFAVLVPDDVGLGLVLDVLAGLLIKSLGLAAVMGDGGGGERGLDFGDPGE
jgi:hypothetical protein